MITPTTSLILNDEQFENFLKLIHALTGITIASNRKSMVEGRVRKRVVALGLPSYTTYLETIRASKEEQAVFVDLVTTNETYFFRTPRIWDYIENRYLPAWFQAHPKQIFLAWSAAASSGEEAHSLGIVCQAFKEKNPSFLYKIVGTDISNQMVSLCEKGEYAKKSVEQFKTLKPDLFQKYLKVGDQEKYSAPNEIRSRLRFQQHNLFNSLLCQERFDLVLLRNVLIYFNQKDQEDVLSKISLRMNESSTLIIGESESLSHVKSRFQHLEPLIYTLKSEKAG